MNANEYFCVLLLTGFVFHKKCDSTLNCPADGLNGSF